ncbi:DUF6624 domain-containing protein [Chromobacterium amazonense]|uniref:DUF6624 domain-containing protein n=1 Tax=Chromobacterium amazonense TaxID=1382803 RepID=UPI00111463A5|nr:DUF6624 domain-containing protein [Chromobacterium amazonense]
MKMMRGLLLAAAVCCPLAAWAGCDWPRINEEFHQILDRDQTGRKTLEQLEAEAMKMGLQADPARVAAIWEKQNRDDAANRRWLDELVARCGWPQTPNVEKPVLDVAWFVLQHADQEPIEYRLKYLPYLRQSVARGDLAAKRLAMYEDRVQLQQGKPQRYGSQAMQVDGGVSLLLPVEDPERLDERRKAIGLQPICEYLQHFVPMMGPVRYPPCIKPQPPEGS